MRKTIEKEDTPTGYLLFLFQIDNYIYPHQIEHLKRIHKVESHVMEYF